jgi:RNA polymerase sigma factor (sigma-70 family)
MAASPTTQPSLLLRLRDRRDHDAWSRFTEVYGPLVYALLKVQGLQDADAADVSQEVMVDVSRAIERFEYRPERGFRPWLFTVVRNRLLKYWREKNRQPSGSGDTRAQQQLMELPAPEIELSAWEETYQRKLFQYAADVVRGDFSDSTWRAFWRTAVEGEVPKQVAKSLGLTVAAVYLAKARVIARIREQVEMLEGEQACPSTTVATRNSSGPP